MSAELGAQAGPAGHAAVLGRLLAASLRLWRADAQLLPGTADSPLLLHVPAREEWLSIAAAPAGEAPIRWWISWHRQPPAAGQPGYRRKPCASTLGLLRTLREALGVAAQGKARVGGGVGSAIRPASR